MNVYKYKCGDENNCPDFKEFLRYEPNTGYFYWIKNTGIPRHKNTRAGYVQKDGRRYITLQGSKWHASRLAWYFAYGKFPSKYIDHINGDRDDNRIVNLREVTPRQNSQNLKIHRNGKLVGSRKRAGNKWEAIIRINRKMTYLGCFDTEQEASDRYWQEVARLSNQEATK